MGATNQSQWHKLASESVRKEYVNRRRMMRYFNTTGSCNPKEHYMVNLDSRLNQIKKMIEQGRYFCINRGRQYGKTTTLRALEHYISGEYDVVSMDFQTVSSTEFQTETNFVKALVREFISNAV